MSATSNWPATESAFNGRFTRPVTISEINPALLQKSGSRQHSSHLQAFRVLEVKAADLPLPNYLDRQTAIQHVERSAISPLLKLFPTKSQLLSARNEHTRSFHIDSSSLYIFYDNLAQVLERNAQSGNATVRTSRQTQPITGLSANYVSGSGLGLSSSQHSPTSSDHEDQNYVEALGTDIVTPEIITQVMAVGFLTVLCREFSTSLEFTSEQVAYTVSVGNGSFVAIDDGGINFTNDSRRQIILECKPRLAISDDRDERVLAQHVAELLGLMASRIHERTDYSSVDKTCILVTVTQHYMRFKVVIFTPEYIKYLFRPAAVPSASAEPPSSPPNLGGQARDDGSPTPYSRRYQPRTTEDHAGNHVDDGMNSDSDTSNTADEEPPKPLPFMKIHAGRTHDLSTEDGRITAAVEFRRVVGWVEGRRGSGIMG